ncbi:MAG TPA: hypothetical protein VFE62_18050 [Gemmataceae bacterium]|nr:hypothetical protein [Gemmataceae bacterium]
MRRHFLTAIAVVSTLAVVPCVVEAQKEAPKKGALPNQVYVKIILPADPAARDKSQPVVESWISEELKKRVQTKFTAATGWVPLVFKKFEATEVWDGKLGDKHCFCDVSGDIPERADGRITVLVHGWGPAYTKVTISLKDEPGSRAIAAVKGAETEDGLPYVAVLIGPPAEKSARLDRPEASEESLKKCLNKTAKEVVEHFKLKDAEWHWIDEPPGILRGVSYSVNKQYFNLYIADGEKLFRRFNEKRKWNHDEFLACKIGGINFHSRGVYFDIGPAVPFQFRRPPKSGK